MSLYLACLLARSLSLAHLHFLPLLFALSPLLTHSYLLTWALLLFPSHAYLDSPHTFFVPLVHCTSPCSLSPPHLSYLSLLLTCPFSLCLAPDPHPKSPPELKPLALHLQKPYPLWKSRLQRSSLLEIAQINLGSSLLCRKWSTTKGMVVHKKSLSLVFLCTLSLSLAHLGSLLLLVDALSPLLILILLLTFFLSCLLAWLLSFFHAHFLSFMLTSTLSLFHSLPLTHSLWALLLGKFFVIC